MTLAILQARTSSTRLPEKVLKPILGRPMLSLEIERILKSRRIDKLIVATSSDLPDERIEGLCNSMGINCFRGSLDDVLDRFYNAALLYKPDHIVRITGDCPLIDPYIIDTVIEFYINGGFDYVSNALQPTFPDGMDVEVFAFTALATAWREASLPSHREHVTPFINQQCDRFKVGNFENAVDLSFLRWTVDEPEDFQLVTQIFEALYSNGKIFTMKDILEYIEKRPELKTMNAMHVRNEGFQKSLREDRMFTQDTNRG
ncbi:MAG: glycosyltransferase family protein [Nitrospirae bacterium]|nr:glycosyltransferase family protein [Nitrospirota bacterium]